MSASKHAVAIHVLEQYLGRVEITIEILRREPEKRKEMETAAAQLRESIAMLNTLDYIDAKATEIRSRTKD